MIKAELRIIYIVIGRDETALSLKHLMKKLLEFGNIHAW